MNNCKNCKYFQRNTEPYENNNFGECSCDKFVYDYLDLEESETDKLYYWDVECYRAYFEVGENFGCIHFKQKELIDE